MILEIRDEVITLSGTLQKNHWATLESAMTMRLRHHPAGVILDLGGLTHVSPDGALTFREAATQVIRVAPGARLVLANVPSNVQRVLRQTGGLTSGLAIAGTIAEARVSLGATADLMGTTNGDATKSRLPRGDIDETERRPTLLVGLFGTAADEHAVAIACRIAQSTAMEKDGIAPASRMYLAHILVVPRDRSLLAPVDDEEVAAATRLKQFSAAAKASGAISSVVTQIERTRDGGIRLTDLANDLHATFLVLAVATNASAEEVAMARYVVQRVQCEVVVNRVPLSNQPSGDKPAVNL